MGNVGEIDLSPVRAELATLGVKAKLALYGSLSDTPSASLLAVMTLHAPHGGGNDLAFLEAELNGSKRVKWFIRPEEAAERFANGSGSDGFITTISRAIETAQNLTATSSRA